MTEEITNVIKKLEGYQDQIKERTKKEIFDMVSTYEDDIFKYVEYYQTDTTIELITYRLETIKNIDKMILFLNFNFNPEFLKKLVKDIRESPVLTTVDGSCGHRG